MLEFIRKHANSTTFKIFLGVLASTFVFCFGIFDIIRRITGHDYIVKIGSVKITPTMFAMEKSKKLNMLRSHEKNIDEKTEINNILHQIIWENVIDQTASEFGFSISEETIKKYIAGMGLFRDKEGNFNVGMLRNFLHNINVSEAMFIEFSGKDIKNALIKAPFKYISVYKSLDKFIQSNLEKRTLGFLEIDPSSLVISEKPSKEDLEEFYNNNQELFYVNETRDFTVIELFEDDIAKTITISEDEKKEYYETSPEREDRTYAEMEKEIIDEIKQNKLQNEIDDKTRQIEDALIAGENIDEVIKKFNLHVMRIKNASASTLNKDSSSSAASKYKTDIHTVAFSTEEGSDSSFAESINEKQKKFLWLVHVDSITPKHVAKFADITDKVSIEWKKSKQHDKAIELATLFCEKAKDGVSLSTIALQNKRKISFTKPFYRSGIIEKDPKKKDSKNDKEKKLTPQEQKMMEVAANFADQAFKKEKGTTFYKDFGTSIVVAQVEKIIPIKDVDNEINTKCHIELVRSVSDDLYQQLVGYLSREKYEIKINREMLEKTGADSSNVEDIF